MRARITTAIKSRTKCFANETKEYHGLQRVNFQFEIVHCFIPIFRLDRCVTIQPVEINNIQKRQQ